jgi:hypothetical protein
MTGFGARAEILKNGIRAPIGNASQASSPAESIRQPVPFLDDTCDAYGGFPALSQITK